ncbi:MAG: tRNA (N6-isopentenyl adenosine(37)-C2)-methylthiotransferase MiaB [Gammaproteobacteria bacterium]|nr:tRNA (N6-isopentenyl adenosine(37)-C2)-methylthiotransferase MiaB [Gammaproteobacteria bacterium]MBU6510204.1 tRNA (N6-isopentenyl adenosine(37)-C2)-methylthiotransferase MiaB [Gammaproteobacteria bacterium]MDE1983153.1 tRNA (N6-isopentenyl adenosine(37)-C2)-methylthiotransferase MiaB [Gammaproteobacteria bacterium]MDE2108039.1 tRNA (N6-isopentenyl adenosine(37)-C2)-methylthiotransferase MiaB [Gammaproteobacteria bacterium]MDE2461016.1 tRNA (N6-isopentenyl adenosine(37)-C2)-methylthiotransfe
MPQRLFVKTFGCQMNEYDSAKMADVLRVACGFELTTQPEAADVLLLNTCSVREKAEDKVFSQLGLWRELKQQKPGLVIGVGGCVASQEGEGIVKRAPFVDLVFGPQTLHRLPAMLDETRRTHAPVVDIAFPEIEKFDNLPPPHAEGATAFVSIMEGCSKYCSFCVVPYTRGEEASRPFDDVIAEVAELAEQGVKEVTLLGQNVNGYRGRMQDGAIADLALLIDYVAALDGIERIRFTTSHPLEFNDRLIRAYAERPKLANYLHLPVQSGSDRILSMMKRNYTTLEYRSKIRKLREVRPGISLSTDFIVGFPGETAKDFDASMRLIDDVKFDQAFAFIYSPRPGTPAANLPDSVSHEEKVRRLEQLQARIHGFGQQYMQRLVGTVQRVLVEKRSTRDSDELAGKTECNRWVNFSGNADLIGHFADVVITEVKQNSLRGRLGAVTVTRAGSGAQLIAG